MWTFYIVFSTGTCYSAIANHPCALSLNALILGSRLCQPHRHAMVHFLDRHTPFLDNCHQKLIPIHFYLFSKFQSVVISLNTPDQIYFIRVVILKLTSITESDISVLFLLSIQIIKVNNKSSIKNYDKNN